MEHLNPAQTIVHARVKLICDEIAMTLQDLDFLQAEDWQKAFDIAERFIRWTVYQDVRNGVWAEAGITKLSELADLKVHVNRTASGVHLGIEMPTVMAILRAQDDPNAN